MHLLVTPGSLVRKPVGLCERAGVELPPGRQLYTRDPAEVTCQECIEWMRS